MNTQLNHSERLYAISLLNQFKGDYDTLAFVLEDIKQLPISEAEWEKAERFIDESRWTWNDEKGGVKTIKFSKPVTDYLVEKIESKSKAGELGIDDRSAVTLMKKLKENE